MSCEIEKLRNGCQCVVIGKLTQEIINSLGLQRQEGDIVMWADRLSYIEKHKHDFTSVEQYEKHVSMIPDVIKNPDYIAVHPTKNSIEFIKRIDEIFLVAIRIKNTGSLAFRSAYPLTESQLLDYIKCGSVKVFK